MLLPKVPIRRFEVFAEHAKRTLSILHYSPPLLKGSGSHLAPSILPSLPLPWHPTGESLWASEEGNKKGCDRGGRGKMEGEVVETDKTY